MEQRRLRLGDILDDYCPRERRVTNHAVVAMIEEDIKQTRCTTCDAEHAYKGGRAPKRKKKETPSALYDEVLAGMPESEQTTTAAAARLHLPSPSSEPDTVSETASPGADETAATDSIAVIAQSEDNHGPMTDDNDQRDDYPEPASGIDEAAATVDGPVHRPLIRATLPRPEGQKDARPVPEFTVRHAPQRGSGHGNGQGGFRGERMRMRAGSGFGNGNREPNGNRVQNGQRFHGNRSSGSGRPAAGRGGSSSGFRNGGSNGKRGRGPRG